MYCDFTKGRVVMNVEKLRQIMLEKGVTAYKLAKSARIAQSTLNQIIHKKRKNPNFKTVCKIADALGVDINILKEGEQNENKNKE